MPPPRRQTKERHNLHLMDVKKTPRATHPTWTPTGEGEISNEGENAQGQRNYKSRKEPEEQTARIRDNNTLYKNNYPVFNKIIPN